MQVNTNVMANAKLVIVINVYILFAPNSSLKIAVKKVNIKNKQIAPIIKPYTYPFGDWK